MQLSSLAGVGKILDELRSRGAESLEAILDDAIPDGDGQVRFPSARLATKNQRAPFADEIGTQVGPEQGLPQGRLQTEIELVNRLKKGEVGFASKALQAGLPAMRHLFGQTSPSDGRDHSSECVARWR